MLSTTGGIRLFNSADLVSKVFVERLMLETIKQLHRVISEEENSTRKKEEVDK